jgi:stomatin-like protein 2
MEFYLVLGVIILILVIKGAKIVPQQQAWIIERLGKLDQKLEPGLNLIIPFIDRVAYKHTLKEVAMDITEQSSISKDNVTLHIDGVLYVKVVDPIAASYGVTDPFYAVTQLAQTTMRSEIGKMTMEKTFEERDTLNASIVNSINEAANSWGIQCMRYEIKDIQPPATVLEAMELQVAADRQKRAAILESEGKRQSQINIAEAGKAEVVLESEASYIDQVNRAKGEAEAIKFVADATANSIERIAIAIEKKGGDSAVSLKVAESYVDAFAKIAKESSTLIIPATANDIGSMTAQALTVFNTVKNNTGKNAKK